MAVTVLQTLKIKSSMAKKRPYTFFKNVCGYRSCFCGHPAVLLCAVSPFKTLFVGFTDGLSEKGPDHSAYYNAYYHDDIGINNVIIFPVVGNICVTGIIYPGS